MTSRRRLVLFGPWTPASLTVARSARRLGWDTFFLQASADPYFSDGSFSALAGARHLDPKLRCTPDGLRVVREYVDEVGAAALVAIVDDDLIWLARHRDQFEPQCRVLSPDAASLDRWLSKLTLAEIAMRAGLEVLPTVAVRDVTNADGAAPGGWPVVLRPDRKDRVTPEFKARLASNATELAAVLAACTRLDGPLVAQPLRVLPTLLVHGARTPDGRLLAQACFLARYRFEGFCLTVEPEPWPPGLEAACRLFADQAGLMGPYHLEFLYDAASRRAWFLEVNVRLGGTTDKVTQAGFDEVALLLAAYGLVPPPAITVRSVRCLANTRVLLKRLVSAARGHLTPMDVPSGSRVREVLGTLWLILTARDSILDARDLAGSLRFHFRRTLPRA